MVDSVEIRLDQLTQAIKGLYAKSSMSQGELYSALTNLSQRYENLTNVSSEKIAATLVNEFRKTIDIKSDQTNQQFREFEVALKTLINNQQIQTPKLLNETSKLLQDVSNVYSKLNAQDLALQKIFSSVEIQRKEFPTQELLKLGDNYNNFSKNFDTIISTLDKNFAEFINQVKLNTTNEEFSSIKEQLSKLSTNVSSIISSIAIIDNKYHDLTSLIDAVQNRENIFNSALNEVRALTTSVNNIQESVTITDPRQDIQALETEIKTQSELVKQEIQKILNSVSNTSKTDYEEYFNEITSQITSLKNELLKLAGSTNKDEINALIGTINDLKFVFSQSNPKQDVISLENELKNQIEILKQEIYKVINTSQDGEVKTEVYNLSSKINSAQTNLLNITTGISSTKEEISNLSKTVQNLGTELKDVKNLVNSEILNGKNQPQTEFEDKISALRKDFQSLLLGLTNFKQEINALNSGNIKILQEPIERVLDSLKNQSIGNEIKDLSENLRDTTLEIQSSIQNLQENLNNINSSTSLEILMQISESIPAISDKLEQFRSHVVSENSSSLGEVKTTFNSVVESIQKNLKETIEKIQDETKTISIETTDTLKVDLQRLSDHLVDSVETVIDRVQKEFVNFRTDFQDFSIKHQDDSEKIIDRLQNLEVNLETFSQDTLLKIEETLGANIANNQDVFNETKSDILDSLAEIDRTNKTSIETFSQKIDKLLNSYVGADFDNILEKKSLKESIIDIENKIDRTNLQQIHNAKELLEEIQSSNSSLSMKIANLEESKNLTNIINSLSKITQQIKTIEDFNQELSENLDETKEQIDKNLKENVQKISTLIENSANNSEEKEDGSKANIDELSAKVQEYLSNFEYLKSNISQEIKENLENEFIKIETAIRKISSNDENSQYSYNLEDVESDLAKLRLILEKMSSNSDDFKTLFEKVIELKTVGLENVKINRGVESELSHLSGWCKDTVGKIEDLSDRLDNIQNIGFEDIRTRLIQSEKSKANSNEFCTKIENALKHLIKHSQNQEIKINDLNKKIELLNQAQSESFNPNQFIDIFYENMTQTKMLSNRVEIIEDKINSIQLAVEKLINYVEQ